MGTNAGPCTMLKLLQPHQNAFFHASLLACVFHSTTAANVATHSSPDVDSRIRGAMMGSLVADALTLGTHYEYDAVKIQKFYGKLDQYYAPGEKTGGETHGVGWGARNFHNGNGNGPPKRKGEQTDYGDYNILILKHLAATVKPTTRPFDLSEFIPTWQNAMRGWRAWMCTQTRQTLQQVSQGVRHSELGGNSNAMAVRSAGLFGYYSTEEEVVAAARKAMFTHRETSAHQGNEFFTRVAYRLIHSSTKLSPREAVQQVAAESKSAFIKEKVRQALNKVDEALDPGSDLSKEKFVDDKAITSMARLWDVGKTEPIKVGKASPTEGTLPASVYLILKYEDNLVAAAKANAMVGGDSASRAIAVGLVLGATHGVDSIPHDLRSQLNHWDHCEHLISKLPLLSSPSEL